MGTFDTDPPRSNGDDSDNTLLYKIANKLFGGGAGGTPASVVIGANTSTTAATATQGVKAVGSAGTPERLVASSTLVESVEIFARKGKTTANTGNIYVGFSSSAASNTRVLEPGETWQLTAPAGKKIDLNLIYVDAATTADAVTYTSVN
jgi:hypothetical protein